MQSHIIQCQQNKTNKSETLSAKVHGPFYESEEENVNKVRRSKHNIAD